MVHAIGWAGLFNGFRDSKKDKPVKWQEFLPYSDVDDASTTHHRISKSTAVIFGTMYRRGLLPVQVIGAASAILDEVKDLSGVDVR